MRNALEGKVALVTGGGRGIGAAVALRLAEEGADVALTFQRDQQRADGVADRIKGAGRRAIAVRADSADPAAVRHMGAGGRIISIGSNMAERAVFPGFSLYAMSKTALTGLTKALGRELGPGASPSIW